MPPLTRGRIYDTVSCRSLKNRQPQNVPQKEVIPVAESAYDQYRREKQSEVSKRLVYWSKEDCHLGAELQEMAKAMRESSGQAWVDAAKIVLDLLREIADAGGLPRINSEHRNQVAEKLPWSGDMVVLPQAAYDREMIFLGNVKKYRRLLCSVTMNIGVILRNHPPAEKAARFWVARILFLLRVARRT